MLRVILLIALSVLACALPAQAQKKLKTVEDYLARAGEYIDTKPDKALADYMAALKLDSTYCGVYSNIGIVKKLKKDYKGALEYYSKAIDCARSVGNIQEAPTFIMNRAWFYHSIGNYSDAVKDFRLIISLDSTRPNGYSLASNELLFLKKYDEALKTAEMVFTLPNITEENKAGANLRIAFAQMFKGDMDAALATHKTYQDYKFEYATWKEYVAQEFANFRKEGLPTENMSKVEAFLKIAPGK